MRCTRGLRLAGAWGLLIGVLLIGCSGGNGAGRTPTTTPAPTQAMLGDESFVAVRTLPADALTGDELESAGVAVGSDGQRTAMARAATEDVAMWETVSPTDGGWRVWRPEAVIEALRQAGQGATIASVAPVDWPDSCLDVMNSGVACAQVITPGYRIILDLDGGTVEYHADRRSPPHLVRAGS